jgi:hypothetical protein
MADVCGCGKPIEQPATGRRRRKCTSCSPVRDQSHRKAPVLAMPGLQERGERRRSLAEQTRIELEAAGRQETAHGIAALGLAELFDAGGYNAQGAAALVKAHRDALAVALEGADREADVIDRIFGTG